MINLQDLHPFGPDLGRVTLSATGAEIAARPATDAFTPPDGGAAIDRLPGLRMLVPEGPWRLSARVEPAFRARFDAGALMVRSEAGAWAKLAFERAPDGRNMAVSVVTRDTSDDSNGPAFPGPALWLRALSTGKVVAFHTSTDGSRWDLLRLFALPGRVGAVDLIAQSPTGEGCTARFSDLAFATDCPQDLRDGT
jgi:regulation of enolase protein 1 (concanavalin A-like superfamily)